MNAAMKGTGRIRRLLAILPGDRAGGAEAHTLRVLDAAARAGAAITLAASPALHPALAGPGRTLLDLPLAWRRGLPARARQAQAEAARAAIAAAGADAALLPLPWPDQAGGALEALAEARLPTLVVAHLAPHGEAPPPGLDEPALAAARAARAAWIAVSAPTARRLERFLGLPPGRVDTVPNGVDPAPPMDRAASRAALRAEHALPPDRPVALFLGRLEEAKGADRLHGLAEGFARRCGGAVIAAGEGALAESLRKATPPGHPLILPGHHPRPAALLAGADLLLMPSRLEGAPLAFLEAATHRLPVAASHAALEALGTEAARYAALADGEDLGEMADAMAACLAPAGPAAARAEAAWRLATAWDAEAMAAACLARLRRLVAAGG